LTFELPPPLADSPGSWRRCLDTALASPDDINIFELAPVVSTSSYLVQPRSVVLLARAVQTPTGTNLERAP
jgi:hypothetical protein